MLPMHMNQYEAKVSILAARRARGQRKKLYAMAVVLFVSLSISYLLYRTSHVHGRDDELRVSRTYWWELLVDADYVSKKRQGAAAKTADEEGASTQALVTMQLQAEGSSRGVIGSGREPAGLSYAHGGVPGAPQCSNSAQGKRLIADDRGTLRRCAAG